MRKHDAIFVSFSVGSMILGVFMPFVADSMRWVPRVTMLTLLFVSFLSIDGKDVWQNLRHFPGAVALLVVLKLIVMPIACWAVFSLVMPEFALAAALLGGSSVAVTAPFYAFLVQADFVLVLAGLVATSLLLPFVLPAMLSFLSFLAVELGRGQGSGTVDLAAWSMAVNLAIMIIIPFIAAQFLRKNRPEETGRILRHRLAVFTIATSLGNIGVFSQYSGLILQSPDYLLKALGCAFFAATAFFVISTALTFWLPPAKQLSCVISCVTMNTILMVIISMEFFSMTEALFAAMYTAPFLLSVMAYRPLGRLRGYSPPA